MLDVGRGKLLVYVSNNENRKKRLKAVSVAVKKTARMLNLGVKVVLLRGVKTPIYIYYEDGENEPVPLYCSKGEDSAKDIYTTLRSMMFVLSFHPKYSALRKIQREIIRFS